MAQTKQEPSELEAFDSLMADLGIEIKPNTPEEDFFDYITVSPNKGLESPRFANLLTWLSHEIAHFHHMQDENIVMTVARVENGQRIAKPLTTIEYAKIMLKYYFCMYFLERFQTDYYIGAQLTRRCDFGTTVNLFMDDARIKKLCSDAK